MPSRPRSRQYLRVSAPGRLGSDAPKSPAPVRITDWVLPIAHFTASRWPRASSAAVVSGPSPRSTRSSSGRHWWCTRGAAVAAAMFMPFRTVETAVGNVLPGPFAYAEGWDEGAGAYRGLVIENAANAQIVIDSESVIVRPEVAEASRPAPPPLAPSFSDRPYPIPEPPR